LFDAVTIDYYKPDHDTLRKVQPFKTAIFLTALEIKTILDELYTIQKQLVRAEFMFRLLKHYEERGFDPNLILELMQRVVPQVFPLTIKAAPQDIRLNHKHTINAGQLPRPQGQGLEKSHLVD
jgi:hypothetical protein